MRNSTYFDKSDYHRLMDEKSIQKSYAYHLKYTLSKSSTSVSKRDRFVALLLSIRDRLVERWMETEEEYRGLGTKRVYYLSMEYLLGRSLGNNILNLGIWELCKKSLKKLGVSMEDLLSEEMDAGLGNGGLGRLAACFLDSMATLSLPGMGYGLRYEYGIFRQKIQKGYQKEEPDQWLRFGNLWEIERIEDTYPVHFGGHVEMKEKNGKIEVLWIPSSTILAVPFDVPIIGYGSDNVNTLRLWSAQASEDFHFEDFNEGDYIEAVKNKIQAENLTKVLYPNDNNHSGKQLRFRQQYFFVSSSLYDIFCRFKKEGYEFEQLPDKVAIQLNDTHPSMSIAEFMRVLVDEVEIPWEKAWDLTTRTFGYTNHTLLPEALEKWPIHFFQKDLPRHFQIIQEINRRFLEEVSLQCPGDNERLKRMSIIEDGDVPQVRMAHLSTVGSHSVNGVSELHTELLQAKVLKDFFECFPQRFNAKTNGVTPRRWLLKCNPPLATWITQKIGSKWVTHLDELKKLEAHLDNPKTLCEFEEIKKNRKEKLGQLILDELDIDVNPEALFDIHIKRLHEYKRQLLNVLHIIMLYNRLKKNPNLDIPPRVFLFAGKSAPGYFMAKRIIKLIHSVGKVINRDPHIKDKIKVVFLPNYGVSMAEIIIPAADLSEQISTAGHEASGTGNMKLSLNGALTIGTLDGANVEILEEVGEENIFIFGMETKEVEFAKENGTYDPKEIYQNDPEIKAVLDLIRSNFFCLDEPEIFEPIIHELLEQGDRFFVLADLRAYADCQERVGKLYQNKTEWNRKALLNIARMGKFSSDRTIREYAKEIWKIEPCPVNMKKKKSSTMRMARMEPEDLE